MKKISLVLLISCISLLTQAQDVSNQLYKVTLLRAKPGALLELIDNLKEDINNHRKYGLDKPYLLRHSQGDQWDLMLIYPIDDIPTYFSRENINKRSNAKTLEQSYGNDVFNKVSFQEEAIVQGPDKSVFNKWCEEYSLYHIEIFTSLSGKQQELLKERRMENDFLEYLDRRPNMIFTRVFGPAWDIFTIGVYKDMYDYAGPDISFEAEDKAAKKSGFEGVNYIGSYLRELLLEHHDTIAKKVK